MPSFYLQVTYVKQLSTVLGGHEGGNALFLHAA